MFHSTYGGRLHFDYAIPMGEFMLAVKSLEINLHNFKPGEFSSDDVKALRDCADALEREILRWNKQARKKKRKAAPSRGNP